ncbi:hypothetical protein H2204_001657 [Knufia peltigerae]|uniref:catechol O-methyltransferase n=1 Tax=Knufia peltigerae TaxID=1002370 RepID=A0AA38YE88_9EURO|nr:hypothetical protein H2204_001657 [Knufia peltigerae]
MSDVGSTSEKLLYLESGWGQGDILELLLHVGIIILHPLRLEILAYLDRLLCKPVETSLQNSLTTASPERKAHLSTVINLGQKMADFNLEKKYQEQEETFFDDGREIELLHFIYSNPDIETIRNSPTKVLAAIDNFARTKKYLMNVGEDKGRIVADLIAEVKPEVMVELGGYIGYSCVLFGDAVRKAGGKRYFSLERNPEFAAVIASLVDLAGLSDIVKVIVGSSDVSIKRLHASGDLKHIDLMFLDHYKPAYTTDLKLCEELGLITPSTVLAADNVIAPGNPPYLEYVRSSVEQKKRATKFGGTVNGVDSRFADKTANQYLKREGKAQLDETRVGNPLLIYESKLVNSFEPSGVPVRKEPSFVDV